MTTKQYIIIGAIVVALLLGGYLFFKSKTATTTQLPNGAGSDGTGTTGCEAGEDERKDGFIKDMLGVVSTNKKIKLPNKNAFDIKATVTSTTIQETPGWLAQINDFRKDMTHATGGMTEAQAVCVMGRWVVGQRFFY